MADRSSPSPSPSSLVQPAIFVPRIRFLGVLHWLCAYSGHFNRSHLTPWDFRLKCGGDGCSRRFIPGIHLFPMARGGHRVDAIPPDWVIPDKYIPADMPDGTEPWSGPGLVEAFPAGDLTIVPWRAHEPTHVLVDPASADFNVDLMTRMVRQIAAQGRQDDFEAVRGVRGRVEGVVDLARIGAAFELVAQGHGFGGGGS